jgi:hypothetical protein
MTVSDLLEAHQGVMTDRRHSLKIGDRPSKKERQTTASDWEKATNCDLCYGSKVTATFITIKQATTQLDRMSDKRPGLHPWWASYMMIYTVSHIH